MTFLPGITSDARTGLLFAINGQSLAVAGKTIPTAPIENDVYLGELNGHPCFARVVDEPLPDTQLVPLRQLFGAISDEEFGIAGRALGLTAWDRDHAFCGRCGTATQRSTTERVRICPHCGFAAYPRLSPAVIMLVVRDGKALLARNARTKMPFHSTLAGFVEVGETLEEAVAREVKEEAGIAISDIRYFGSQPWPFSGSLMIGFMAKWASGEITMDPVEIMDAQWFGPDEIPVVPPKLSIARELIDAFVVEHSRK
ncbi:MAG: NAD(+) diphosphatase [Kofleriaceae bacterium]